MKKQKTSTPRFPGLTDEEKRKSGLKLHEDFHNLEKRLLKIEKTHGNLRQFESTYSRRFPSRGPPCLLDSDGKRKHVTPQLLKTFKPLGLEDEFDHMNLHGCLQGDKGRPMTSQSSHSSTASSLETSLKNSGKSFLFKQGQFRRASCPLPLSQIKTSRQPGKNSYDDDQEVKSMAGIKTYKSRNILRWRPFSSSIHRQAVKSSQAERKYVTSSEFTGRAEENCDYEYDSDEDNIEETYFKPVSDKEVTQTPERELVTNNKLLHSLVLQSENPNSVHKTIREREIIPQNIRAREKKPLKFNSSQQLVPKQNTRAKSAKGIRGRKSASEGNVPRLLKMERNINKLSKGKKYEEDINATMAESKEEVTSTVAIDDEETASPLKDIQIFISHCEIVSLNHDMASADEETCIPKGEVEQILEKSDAQTEYERENGLAFSCRQNDFPSFQQVYQSTEHTDKNSPGTGGEGILSETNSEYAVKTKTLDSPCISTPDDQHHLKTGWGINRKPRSRSAIELMSDGLQSEIITEYELKIGTLGPHPVMTPSLGEDCVVDPHQDHLNTGWVDKGRPRSTSPSILSGNKTPIHEDITYSIQDHLKTGWADKERPRSTSMLEITTEYKPEIGTAEPSQMTTPSLSEDCGKCSNENHLKTGWADKRRPRSTSPSVSFSSGTSKTKKEYQWKPLPLQAERQTIYDLRTPRLSTANLGFSPDQWKGDGLSRSVDEATLKQMRYCRYLRGNNEHQ